LDDDEPALPGARQQLGVACACGLPCFEYEVVNKSQGRHGAFPAAKGAVAARNESLASPVIGVWEALDSLGTRALCVGISGGPVKSHRLSPAMPCVGSGS
jgi:hypothetical protein